MDGNLEGLIADGYLARRQGRSAEAKSLFVEAVDEARRTGDRLMLAQALAGAGQVERDLGNMDTARRHYEASVELLRHLNDPVHLAHTVRHVGDILRHLGQPEDAATHYEEALTIYRGQNPPPLDLANALRGFALCQELRGLGPEASSLWREARSLYAAVNVDAGVEEADKRIAELRRRTGTS